MKSTATGVSVSCSGVWWPKMSTDRPERDDGEGHEAHRRRDRRRQDEDDLVGALGDDVFLQGQLDAVGERLQQAERARPGWGRDAAASGR